MSLLVVGTIAFDSVDTPSGRREDVLGGSASFLTTAASYFCHVHMAGVVGHDFPEAYLAFFKSRGVDVAGVQQSPGRTFRWRGQYTPEDMNTAKTLATELNVLENFDPNLPDGARDCDYVALGNFDPVLQMQVLDQVRAPKFVACDTMNYWIERHNAKLRKTLSRVDLLSINETEARALSGEENLMRAAQAVQRMGPRMVVIKRGEYGALLFCNETVFVAPAFLLPNVCDPTGAGDSFAGGMLGHIARTGKSDATTLRQAVAMGTVLASFAVEDFSLDRMRTLTSGAIEKRYTQFQQLIDLDREPVHLPALVPDTAPSQVL